MRWSLIIVTLFMLNKAGFAQTPDYDLNAKDFRRIVEQKSGSLLDVRTSGEFKNGHLIDAGQLNYYAFDFKQKLLLLPKEQPVYLYCNTGYRSKRAANFLLENGYSEVYNLRHGILEWNYQNFEVITEPDAKPSAENKMEPDEFYALIRSTESLLIDFYAPWCAPCRQMMPIVDSLKIVYQEQTIIAKVNVDASKKLMKELGILSVPYFARYSFGELKQEMDGLLSLEELESMLQLTKD